jgi:hypothetical protein
MENTENYINQKVNSRGEKASGWNDSDTQKRADYIINKKVEQVLNREVDQKINDYFTVAMSAVEDVVNQELSKKISKKLSSK